MGFNSGFKGLKYRVEIGRPCGRNGSAQRGATYSYVELKNGQKENWETEDSIGRHCQESSRRTVVTNSPTLERMAWIHTTFANPVL